MALKRAVVLLVVRSGAGGLASEAVQGAALPLERVHHVHGGHRLPLGVLGVGDGVADHVLQENLEHAAGLLVDQAGDTLHSAAASQAADGGFGDSLDVVAENFAVTLGASFPESLASFAASAHDDSQSLVKSICERHNLKRHCGRDREIGRAHV